MTGFLGGLFKPEEYITYKDAVKAALTMLGYSDEDFTGDLASSRISKFNYLELNEEMNRQPEEVLNQTDCMNLFYNLLKTKKKDSSEIYGAVLDCELNSDGEINPITILDDERKGPILVRKGFSVIQSVPFGSENANVFLNGTASTLEAVKASQQDAGFAVVYYNVKSKTIWAYTTRGWDCLLYTSYSYRDWSAFSPPASCPSYPYTSGIFPAEPASAVRTAACTMSGAR